AFLLMGAAIALMWPSGAMVGQWLGNVIDADLLGLDAAFPIILFCLIRGDLKNRATLSLTVAGILIAVALTPLLPLGLGAVTSLSVFVLVAAGWAVRWLLGRRRGGLPGSRRGGLPGSRRGGLLGRRRGGAADEGRNPADDEWAGTAIEAPTGDEEGRA